MREMQSLHSRFLWCTVAILFALSANRSSVAEDKPPRKKADAKKPAEKIDWNKARRIRRKALNGEKLTKEERAYYERAKKARAQLRKNNKRPQSRLIAKTSVGFTPLTDMKADDKYKGQDGGLYGGGKNVPPAEHLKAALAAVAKIRPLNAQGKPAADGKIVMISNGMSNTTQEFRQFIRLANADDAKSASLQIVDGAFGGMEASDWAYPEKRFRKGRPSPWDLLDRQLKQSGVTAQQVQVVWILQARRQPASLGAFPKHAQELKDNLIVLLQKLKQRFPNLQLAYLSSRIYAGYASSNLNPEPYAYESAFSIRWLIDEQRKGKESLNYDSSRGKALAPVVLWGPYLWADGEKGRKTDRLVWKREDLARDGTHPSETGRRKVAQLLLQFFKTDPTAKPWFTGKTSSGK